MKISRLNKYSTPYGSIEFIPANTPGFSYRIAFKGELTMHYQVACRKITNGDIAFWVRVILAERAGFPKYHYSDKKIDPPLPSP